MIIHKKFLVCHFSRHKYKVSNDHCHLLRTNSSSHSFPDHFVLSHALSDSPAQEWREKVNHFIHELSIFLIKWHKMLVKKLTKCSPTWSLRTRICSHSSGPVLRLVNEPWEWIELNNFHATIISSLEFKVLMLSLSVLEMIYYLVARSCAQIQI